MHLPMVIPIMKLIPEKRPRFLLRTVFFGSNKISDAPSFTFNSSIKPLLVAERELMDCWLAYGSSTVFEEGPDKKASVSTGFF